MANGEWVAARRIQSTALQFDAEMHARSNCFRSLLPAVASFDALNFSYSFFTLVLLVLLLPFFVCSYSLAHAIRADAHTPFGHIMGVFGPVPAVLAGT